jgi:RNA polymerase sigma-70 factor (ECF subfamily)
MRTSRHQRAAARPQPDDELRELIAQNADAIYRVAYSIVRDRHLAEDVVQESVMKAWTALPTYRGDGSLRGWMLSIAHNTAISFLRRARTDLVTSDAVPERRANEDVESSAQSRDDLNTLWAALDDLDPLTRSIIVMRDIEGMPYQSIAEALGVALPTVKSRLLRGRRALQKAVEEGAPA